MKILLLGHEEKSLSWLKKSLSEKNINSDHVIVQKNQPFKDLLNTIFLKAYSALVFDRIEECMQMAAMTGKIDCFFIVDIRFFDKKRDFDWGAGKFRYYFWPLNINILADDIKSIVLLKDFLVVDQLNIGKLFINTNRRTVSCGSKVVQLKNKEFDLLLYLAKNRGRVISRNNILENVWDMNTRVMTNTVDVHVSKIRKALRDNFGIKALIKTIPCNGYILG